MVKCTKCDYHAEYTPYGYLDGGPYARLDEYDKFQKDYIYSIDFNKYKDNNLIQKLSELDVLLSEELEKTEVM